MPEMDNKILVGLVGLIAGVYGWLLKHLSNSKKHPCADKLVYQDLCGERSKRLEDCIEAEVRASKERYETLAKKVDDGFKEIKGLIEKL